MSGAQKPKRGGVPAQLGMPSRVTPTSPIVSSGRGKVGVVNTAEETPIEEPAEDMGHQEAEPLQLAHPNVQDSSVPGEATSEKTEQATAELVKPQQEVT